MNDQKHRHEGRNDIGRYVNAPACDSCGKPCVLGAPLDCGYMTDEEVCGGSDGPGFHLCYRKRCAKRYEGLDVEQRRALFELQRAENVAAVKGNSKPRTVVVPVR